LPRLSSEIIQMNKHLVYWPI